MIKLLRNNLLQNVFCKYIKGEWHMSNSFFVYRFMNNLDQVIYVGKTKNSLSKRFKSHRHLPDDCYASVKRIEYISCLSESDMTIKEIFYINKYSHENHITYNVADATAPSKEIELNDEWIFYDGFLPKWFSSSINHINGYKEENVRRYKKDGSIKKTEPHRKSGYNYDVFPLTDEEVYEVESRLWSNYQNAPNKEDEQIRLRNLIIFMTGIQYPAKISVVLNLKYKDIFDEHDTVKALIYPANRSFKDYQFRFQLDNNLISIFQLYRTKYNLSFRKNSEDNLFMSRENKVLSVGSYNNSLKKTVRESGFEKNVGGETLRKTYGLHIYTICSDKLRAFDYLEIIYGTKGYGEVGKYLCLISRDYDYDSFLKREYAYTGNDTIFTSIKQIPKSYYRNTELMEADKMNLLVSPQEFQKNIENGKYYLSDGEYVHITKTKPE